MTDDAALMVLWLAAFTGWLIAGVALLAVWYWRAEVERQRRARSVADYAAHKAAEREAAAVARNELLLIRLGRTQARTDDIAETAAAVAMAAQLDGLYGKAADPG